MERLTKRTGNGKVVYALLGPGECVDVIDLLHVWGDRLAAYEDAMPLERAKEFARAEKDGRLVVLPCKPDAVAWAHSTTGDLSEFRFEGIYISEDNEIAYQTYWVETFSLGDFGKTVFLTREEAEAALKKRE